MTVPSSKPVNFVLLTDSFTFHFQNFCFLKNLILNATTGNIKQLSGFEKLPGLSRIGPLISSRFPLLTQSVMLSLLLFYNFWKYSENGKGEVKKEYLSTVRHYNVSTIVTFNICPSSGYWSRMIFNCWISDGWMRLNPSSSSSTTTIQNILFFILVEDSWLKTHPDVLRGCVTPDVPTNCKLEGWRQCPP